MVLCNIFLEEGIYIKKAVSLFLALVMIIALSPATPSKAAPFPVSKGIQPMPFNRYYQSYSGCHYYSTGGGYSGYNYEGIEGYVLSVPLPNTIPLYMCSKLTYLYTTNESEYGNLLKNYGFYDHGIVGYVKPADSSSINTTVMYRWYNDEVGHDGDFEDHFYTISPENIGIVYPQYHYEGKAFSVWKSDEALASLSLSTALGGETYTAGSKIDVTWQGTANIDSVDIYLSTDSGDTWNKVDNTKNTGTYSLQIPKGLVSNFCRIKIEWDLRSYYGNVIDTVYSYSGADFKIVNPPASNDKIILPKDAGFNLTVPIVSAPTNLTGDYDGKVVSLSWSDNAAVETAYIIERKSASSAISMFSKIATLPANSKSYVDTTAVSNSSYVYRVKAAAKILESPYSNEVSIKTLALRRSSLTSSSPQAPAGLTAALSGNYAALSWSYGSSTITGFKIERKEGSGSFVQIGLTAPESKSYTDSGLKGTTKYTYRVIAYAGANSAPSNEASITTLSSTVISFTIGNSIYKVNGTPVQMDVTPATIFDRVMLPVKYVCDPIGATYSWNEAEESVTINKGSTSIKLYVGNNTAILNGQPIMIDSNNPLVVPVIVPPGRTLMPFRFICEKLGGTVAWDDPTQTATATFSA